MDTANACLNILVVEDNTTLRESVVDALDSLGHHVRGIECAESLPEQMDLLRLDLAILDLNLPGEDGLSLASRLRSAHPELGIIMLTARNQSDDRAAGYARGADIYLTKPASLSELEQAIGALSRRIKPIRGSDPGHDLALNTVHLTLANAAGHAQTLTTGEASLLTAFARASQNILENWQIAEILGMDPNAMNKPAIELHIVRLRKKLPLSSAGPSPIKSIRGRGYQLCIPIRLE